MHNSRLANFLRFIRTLKFRLRELRAETGRKTHYVVSVAAGVGEQTIRQGYDLIGMLGFEASPDNVDFINVMSYDYYGMYRYGFSKKHCHNLTRRSRRDPDARQSRKLACLAGPTSD